MHAEITVREMQCTGSVMVSSTKLLCV